jgi:hypothetical protein
MFRAIYSVNRDVPVQNIQSVSIFSQKGYSNKKYSVSRDVPVRSILSVGIFEQEMIKQ